MNGFIRQYFPWFVLVGIALNATGLFNDVLEPDGALYATIAKHMVISNDWINLISENRDWLDKPHFPFWIAALSFKVFGINSFAYKIPSFIFWLAGIRFTYLLAKALYSSDVARVAVLVYVLALHGVLANFDVRAEPYLTTLVIASTYYIYQVWAHKKISCLVAGALCAACAVMTKGIFILVTIGCGFLIHWISTREWKQFFNYRWYLFAALVFVFIVPELYCLYMQFDRHPEKIVFGRTGVSGIRFFFIDSQFGRFFNTGPIRGKGDPSFFLHTAIWAFLPWGVLLYLAVIHLFRKRKVIGNKAQWIIFYSTAVTFILFSLSKFQLPHYIIILFPHFAMITAHYLVNLFTRQSPVREREAVTAVQTVILIIVSAAVAGLSIFLDLPYKEIITALVACILVVTLFFFRKRSFDCLMIRAYAFALILYPFLNFHFYPYIMRYQSGMMAARWLKQHNYDPPFAMYKEFMPSFEFYADGEPARFTTPRAIKQNIALEDTPMMLYTSVAEADSLKQAGLQVKVVKNFEFFRTSMLTGKFLNPATRSDVTKKTALIQVLAN